MADHRLAMQPTTDRSILTTQQSMNGLERNKSTPNRQFETGGAIRLVGSGL